MALSAGAVFAKAQASVETWICRQAQCVGASKRGFVDRCGVSEGRNERKAPRSSDHGHAYDFEHDAISMHLLFGVARFAEIQTHIIESTTPRHGDDTS